MWSEIPNLIAKRQGNYVSTKMREARAAFFSIDILIHSDEKE